MDFLTVFVLLFIGHVGFLIVREGFLIFQWMRHFKEIKQVNKDLLSDEELRFEIEYFEHENQRIKRLEKKVFPFYD